MLLCPFFWIFQLILERCLLTPFFVFWVSVFIPVFYHQMSNDVLVIKSELTRCIHQCNDRGLLHSAKWAAEQLVGLVDVGDMSQATSSSVAHAPADEILDQREHTIFLLAKTIFDLKEYMRCWHFLCNAQSPKSRFLKYYALYLAGEKRKEEETLELAGGDGVDRTVQNGKLEEIYKDLQYLHTHGSMDAFLLYLYGLVLKGRDMKDEARQAFCASVRAMPCLWASWAELTALYNNVKDIPNEQLPDHWAKQFFYGMVFAELNRWEESLQCYTQLSAIFPQSNNLKSRVAVAHYDLKEYDESAVEFEEVLECDPYQLEYVDMYSNILYVKGDKTALSTLAHRALTIDKFKPETNCIIGNYYSLKSQHEKAVVYFRRALRIDPNCLSAWTLMGHEFVELKNTQAAIDAYRHAVDISPRDYRAWYGLGQTYEILQLYYYALYYFRKAANLRPLDSRMWCAMAGCYENLKRPGEAINCYQRAEVHGDDGIATSKLAQLYQEMKQPHKAAQYYAKFISLHAAEEPQESDRDALLFLANYYKQEGCLDHAEQCCIRLLNFPGPEKEDGKSILQEIQAIRMSK